MILTITLNPAVDKSASTGKLIPEKKLRCCDMHTEPGGGGINVSKAIQKLGGNSTALFPSGGTNGRLLEQMLQAQNILFSAIPVQAPTRESITITEITTNAQYRFVMPGGHLNDEELKNCFAAIKTLVPAPTIIVVSGSLPPGVPEDFIATLAGLAKELEAKCIVDTSGRPLQLATQEGVYLLKPNLSELCSLVGKEYLELFEVDEAAHEVIQRGDCEVVVVSMGPAGAIVVTEKDHERIPAPTVKKLSTVGAGDSMVGGMAWMLEQGASLREVVRFGVACGTDATMNEGTQLFKKEDVWKLYDWINHHSRKRAAAFENT